MRSKQVVLASDVNGFAVPGGERAWQEDDDAERILEMISPCSSPFDKGKLVSGSTGDIDRLLMEMTMSQQREFLWCYLHGVVHLVSQPEKVFAACMHERNGLQTYVEWPDEGEGSNTLYRYSFVRYVIVFGNNLLLRCLLFEG